MNDGNATTNENTVISGGPEGNNPPPAVEATTTQNDKKPLFAGIGRTVHTQEELTDYASHLERQNIEMRLKLEKTPEPVAAQSFQQPNTTQTTQVKPANGEEDPADLLFSDPGRALELVKEKAKREIRAEDAAKQTEKKFWTDLYAENPDLQSADIVVKSVLNENWSELSAKPMSEARKILAERSRTALKGIRGESGKVTEVPNSSQAALGSSNGASPAKTTPAKTATSFIDQVKKFQRKS